MTLREFFNAWIGKNEHDKQMIEAYRNITFSASRFNAASTAFSEEGSKAISRYKFEWEKDDKEKVGGKYISYEKYKNILLSISKEADG